MAEQYGIVYWRKAPYEVLKTDWMSYADILKLKGVEEMGESITTAISLICP